ncbi:unknown [Clostridium sp. CAG:533]|nr:unknown [Clostridium sp. CAG:533]
MLVLVLYSLTSAIVTLTLLSQLLVNVKVNGDCLSPSSLLIGKASDNTISLVSSVKVVFKQVLVPITLLLVCVLVIL